MKFLAVLLIAITTFTGCSVNSSDLDNNVKDEESMTAVYHKISPEEAKELMVDGNITLDVRTKEEYDAGYIPGAVLLPLDDIFSGKFDKIPDKDQTILVYCRSGNRSETAARLLVDEGYTNVYDFGGIIDWKYDIVK